MKRSLIVGLVCLLQLSAFAQAVVGTWKGDLKVGMSKLGDQHKPLPLGEGYTHMNFV